MSDVDARPLWSVEGHGPLRETASDTGNLVGDDLPTSKDGDGRLHREGQSQVSVCLLIVSSKALCCSYD